MLVNEGEMNWRAFHHHYWAFYHHYHEVYHNSLIWTSLKSCTYCTIPNFYFIKRCLFCIPAKNIWAFSLPVCKGVGAEFLFVKLFMDFFCFNWRVLFMFLYIYILLIFIYINNSSYMTWKSIYCIITTNTIAWVLKSWNLNLVYTLWLKRH